MELQLCGYDTCKLAKEKGFNEYCLNGYSKDKELICSITGLVNSDTETFSNPLYQFANGFAAPEQALLQMWLREKHNVHIDVCMHADVDSDEDFKSKEEFNFSVEVNGYGEKFTIPQSDYTPDYYETHFNSYEEALEEGLKQALNLI